MQQEKLTIIPVTLHSDSENSIPLDTSKTVTAEISFYNGLEEWIIQTVMSEL